MIDVLILLIVTIATTSHVETDDHTSKYRMIHVLNLLNVTIATSFVGTDNHTSKQPSNVTGFAKRCIVRTKKFFAFLH